MIFFRMLLKKVLFYASGVISGLLLFTMIFTSTVFLTVFNEQYSHSLLEKYKFFDHAYDVIRDSKPAWKSIIQFFFPNGSPEEVQISSLLDKSTTPDMIRYNLNQLHSGLFSYWKSLHGQLPDIYLEVDSLQRESSSANTLVTLNKINIGTLLEYLNRSDIINILSFIHCIFVTTVFLFKNSFLLFVLLIFIFLNIVHARQRRVQWCKVSIVTAMSGLLLTFTAFSLIYLYLPVHFFTPLTFSLFFPAEAMYNYVIDGLVNMMGFLLIVSFLVACLMYCIYRFSKYYFQVFLQNQKIRSSPSNFKLALDLIFIFVVVYFLFSQSISYNNLFRENNFKATILKIFTSYAYTEVIPASDASIYKLNIKINSETNQSVGKIKLLLDGIESKTQTSIHKELQTNESGELSLHEEKGNFKLQILPSENISKFRIPPPIIFSIENPGSTNIHITLENKEASAKTVRSIIEFELLDFKKQPLQNIEMEVQPEKTMDSTKKVIRTITNKNGIALIHVPSGTYKIQIIGSTLPDGFVLPSPIRIHADHKDLRYTYQLTR